MKRSVKWRQFLPGWEVTADHGTIGFLSYRRKAIYVLQVSRKDPWKKTPYRTGLSGNTGKRPGRMAVLLCWKIKS